MSITYMFSGHTKGNVLKCTENKYTTKQHTSECAHQCVLRGIDCICLYFVLSVIDIHSVGCR